MGDLTGKVAIVTGAGRAFCAGLDLSEMEGERRAPLHDIPGLLRAMPQPVIGAVNGVAVTGGFELLTSCDVLIGSPGEVIFDGVSFGTTPAGIPLPEDNAPRSLCLSASGQMRCLKVSREDLQAQGAVTLG